MAKKNKKTLKPISEKEMKQIAGGRADRRICAACGKFPCKCPSHHPSRPY